MEGSQCLLIGVERRIPPSFQVGRSQILEEETMVMKGKKGRENGRKRERIRDMNDIECGE